MEPPTDPRVLGCLKGIAIGDAIGKQTETLSWEGILRWYPDGVRGFEGEAGTPIPRYVGNSKREWRIGETTDDTERTIAVARAILHDGGAHHTSVGRELLLCTKGIHPGIRSLWDFHGAADPARVTDAHDGCGAAVRVAPVGILYRSTRLREIVTGAREASIPTHGGPLAIAAAAATAAAVSAAVDDAPPDVIIEMAQRAARQAETERVGQPSGSMANAIHAIHRDVSDGISLDPPTIAARYAPTTPLTIVPLALTLGVITESLRDAVLLATNVGGDSDSVASIAGALVGARRPDTVIDAWYDVVEAVNAHDLVSIARSLGALRG